MQRYAFPGLTAFCHDIVRASLQRAVHRRGEQGGAPCLLAVDATCGNGHDTVFMASALHQLMGEGGDAWRLLCFDIQRAAIAMSRKKLYEAGQACGADLAQGVAFIHQGHEHMAPWLQEHPVALAMYNLGYLPGSDKATVTQAQSTLHALAETARCMEPHGLLAVHSYGGHEGGLAEMAAVEQWFCSLPADEWQVARYAVCNKPRNPEVVYAAEKKGGYHG